VEVKRRKVEGVSGQQIDHSHTTTAAATAVCPAVSSSFNAAQKHLSLRGKKQPSSVAAAAPNVATTVAVVVVIITAATAAASTAIYGNTRSCAAILLLLFARQRWRWWGCEVAPVRVS
jgi:hypothetical protein